MSPISCFVSLIPYFICRSPISRFVSRNSCLIICVSYLVSPTSCFLRRISCVFRVLCLPPVSNPVALLSCLVSPVVLCPVSSVYVSCPMSRVSYLIYISCLVCRVSYLLFPIPRPVSLSRVPGPASRVPCPLSRVPCVVSVVSRAPGLASRISYHVSCLMSRIWCLVSRASCLVYLVSSVSCLLFSYLPSCVSCLASRVLPKALENASRHNLELIPPCRQCVAHPILS